MPSVMEEVHATPETVGMASRHASFERNANTLYNVERLAQTMDSFNNIVPFCPASIGPSTLAGGVRVSVSCPVLV